MVGSKYFRNVFPFAFLSALLLTQSAHARTFRIFEVRKNLQLADDEPVTHDYYLNAGTQQGLHQGMTIPVNRKEAVHDFYGDNEDDLLITVGRLKLITVQDNISVGRLIPMSDERKLASTPVLDYATVMIGDRVDLAGAKDDGDGDGRGYGAGNGGGGNGSGGASPVGAAGAGGTESALGQTGSLNTEMATAQPHLQPQAQSQAGTVTAPPTQTAPHITMEPMGPAAQKPQKRAAASQQGSAPKLELLAPDSFKRAEASDGSLVPDSNAPEVNPL